MPIIGNERVYRYIFNVCIMSAKYIYYGVGTLTLGLAIVLWAPSGSPETGQIYRRAAYDSSIVSRIIVSDSASSPLARKLVADLLTRKLRVRIDRVGRCKEVMEHYDAVNFRLQAGSSLLEQAFLAARPVQLYTDDQLRCFAYSITYHIPLPEPMNWQNKLLTKVPLHLTMIHPMTDFKYFKREGDE